MKKNEIVQLVSFANVACGSQLVECDMPGGISVTRITPENTGAGQILLARILADEILSATASCPDEPTSELFALIHSTIRDFSQAVIDGTTEEALELELVAEHCRLIGKLRQIAVKLGIQYEAPEDPILAR